jgi:ABC-2 type transport system permease protein
MIRMLVIAGRELRSHFVSPMAFVVLTVFALIHGLVFSAGFGESALVDAGRLLQSGAVASLWLLMLAMPLLTMGLLAGETSSGTLETLLTAPVTDVEAVAGKYVAGLLLGASLLAVTLVEVVVAAMVVGVPDWGPVLTGYVGLFCVTAQFTAIGLFCSSLSRSQISSAIVTVAVLLGLMLAGLLFREQTSGAARFALRLSPLAHVRAFVAGVIDTRDVVYFVATSALFVFLTVRAVESRRWR